MPRTRDIKPAVFDSERFGRVSHPGFRLWVALLQLADRDGYVERRPMRLKRYAFGYHDEISTEDVESLVQELLDLGVVEAVTDAEFSPWLSIRRFTDHVRTHPKEPSRFTKSPGSAETCSGPAAQKPAPVGTCPRLEKKEEGRQKKEEGRQKTEAAEPEPFAAFWRHYPRRDGKRAAEAAWLGMGARDRTEAVAAVSAQLAWPEGLGLNREAKKTPMAGRAGRTTHRQRERRRMVGTQACASCWTMTATRRRTTTAT